MDPDRADALEWRGGDLCPAAGGARDLLVADSWLVADGAVRGYDAHWRRFAASCRELGVPAGELESFAAAATAALPAAGRWFPRIELARPGAAEPRLALRLRPAPEPRHGARVWAAPPPDPRRHPRRKGPDLELLAGLRRRAQAAGADEALIRDGAGRVLEGALSSLLWWEQDTLCTTPDETALPGVTRGLLLLLARERGIAVRRIAPAPDRLAGREAWLASALHGIRTVDGWVQPRRPAGAAERAADWRRALDELARPLSPPAGVAAR